MNRRLITCFVTGSSLALAVFALAPTFAQDKPSSHSRDRDTGAASATDRIDRRIEDYQSRLGKDLDRSRDEIERMRKDLRELVDLRFDMVLALAELRADTAASMGVNSASVAPGGFRPGAPNGPSSPSGSPGAFGSPAAVTSEKEREQQRSAILHQELHQIQDVLRNELNQARSQTDQLVAQLRALRTQQRQMREQAKSAQEMREHAKSAQERQGRPSEGSHSGKSADTSKRDSSS